MSSFLKIATPIFVGIAFSGCIEEVQNPTGYESQRALCEPQSTAEWQREVDGCQVDYQRDRSCPGIISFTGMLQKQPMVVTTRLAKSMFSDWVPPNGQPILRGRLELTGFSPYFQFTLGFRDIGGTIDGTQIDRLYGFGPGDGTDDPSLDLTNDVTQGYFQVSGAGESISFYAYEGELVVHKQEVMEEVGRFHIKVRGNDSNSIEGCFHAFATLRNRGY